MVPRSPRPRPSGLRSPRLRPTTGLFVASLALLGTGVGIVHGQAPDRVAAAAPVVVGDGMSAADGLLSTTTTAPTTTSAPATTTTAPPPPTTAPPAPAPTAPRAPRPTTTTAAPVPAPTATAVDGPTYAMELIRQVVPARWLAVLPVRVSVIPGTTSWSSFSGLIEISDWHLFHAVDHAKNTLAHEWGHQVAWHYGTDAYEGAPPAGFPYSGRTPEEQWADCVAQALTGTVYPSSGLGACPSSALAFTRAFLDAGPGPKLR